MDENKSKAQNSAKETCAYLAAWTDDAKAKSLGFDIEAKKKIASFIDAGDEKSAARLVDQRMLSALTVTGTPEECVEKCREHLSYDIDQLAFCEPFGPKPMKSISLIAKRIIPKL